MSRVFSFLVGAVPVLAVLVAWPVPSLAPVSFGAHVEELDWADSSQKATATAVPDTSRRAQVGEPVPEFEVAHLRDSSQTFASSDFEGQYVLLNLWATWCAPCLEKVPALRRARERYSSETLSLLNVSFDRSRSAATDFLDERKMPGEHAFAGISELGGKFGAKFAQIPQEGRSIRGLPNLTLVNPDGEVVAILRPGAQTGLQEMLKTHLP